MDWAELRKAKHLANPRHICHLCGQPGGDYLDHKIPGDDHSLDNLDWAHDRAEPHCHRTKSAREGAAASATARGAARRPPERHPALE